MGKIKIYTVGIAISFFLLCHSFIAVAAEEETKEAEISEAKPEEAGPQDTEAKDNKKGNLMERIDFGNSYILGQSIKSGAVYLLHRKKSDIKSMLKTREEYRKEILEDFQVNDDEP